MSEKLILKIGYYSIYEIITSKGTKYRVDSGKTVYLERFDKTIVNKNRVLKDYKTLDDAKVFAKSKMIKGLKTKKKKLAKLPKSLYLVLIEEESTKNIFVKVGITSKKFIARRFSKKYGYDGYELKEILRRVESSNSEKLEEDIKNALTKKFGMKKYRPVMENFSGYSECYDVIGLEKIIKIFDEIVAKD